EAVKHGLHILFDPEIIIHHHNRSRFSGYLTHQFHLGENNAAARLMTNDPRKILRKFKPLLLFLPFIKTAKNYLKILFLNPVQFPLFLLYSPLILTGIFIESAGYARTMGSRR
ncbi:MAG: hypothetical protein KAR14_02745, partial [Candidatus Aminicenantes bacterium]|nr:hypothetical protein [Candidatus Aminicenantes bacterium]